MKQVISNHIRNFIGDNNIFKLKKIVNQLIPIQSYREEKEFREQKKTFEKKSKRFYGKFVKSGDICFDIGANVGNRVKPLLELYAKVIAAEPQKSCYKILEKRFGDTIDIIKKGIGSQEGEKEFYMSSSSTISSFSKDWIDSVKNSRFKDKKWNKKEIINIITLDKMIKEYGKPTFIKIDVEGFEEEVIKGLSTSIPIISYEYTVPEQTKNAINCLFLLQKIDKNIICNYSIGESMCFVFDKWKSVEDMLNHINSNEFIKTGFGDIYIKQKKFIF